MAKYNLDDDFYCCKCGKKGFPIVRVRGKEREVGHLKKLWCINCKQEINHAECRVGSRYDYNDFMLEFEHGNFDEKQNRIMQYGLFKDKLVKAGVI